MNINNLEDKFGKTVGDLTAVWMTMNDDSQRLYMDRIDYHTERMVMNMGFPITGAMFAEQVVAISTVALSALLLDGYLSVTDKGFATMEEPDATD
jgi:hypothetical protein